MRLHQNGTRNGLTIDCGASAWIAYGYAKRAIIIQGLGTKRARCEDITEKTRLMMDIMALAFWSDASRVTTFMFGNSVSDRNFSFLKGVKGNHHSISHHMAKTEALEEYIRITA